MKRIIFAFTTVLALSAISCTRETDIREIQKPEPKEVLEKAVSFRAQVGDATRVSVDNAGAFKWQAGDQVTILTDNGANRTFEATTSGLTTDLSGTIPETDQLVGGYAFYPASEQHASGSFVIEENQVWKADASNMPMFSIINEVENQPNASFGAVGGVLKLICHNIPSSAGYLVFTAASKKISGVFAFDPTESQITLSDNKENPSDSEKRIVIDFHENYSSSKVFYIPLPVVTLTGGFTVAMYANLSDSEPLFSKASTKAATITANKLLIAPALNCASETIIWKETFTGYTTISSNSNSPTSIHTGTGYNAIGDSNITYLLGSSSSVQTGTMYSGASSGSPELLIKSSNPFTVSSIPVGNNKSLELSWYSNKTTLSVTSSSQDVSIGTVSHSSSKHTAIVTINNSPSSYNLVFSATENTRLDDITLAVPAQSYSVPTISSDDNELTINVGELVATTHVALSNAIDGLGISYVISYPDEEDEWIESASIEDGALTITAADANVTADFKTATLTLKASGAADKVIPLRQASCLVQNPPDLFAIAGDGSVNVTWSGNPYVTSYVAYLHTAETETPATGGINISESISHYELDYAITNYAVTNDQTYYLYVKVNTVSEGYVAPSEFVYVTFTPAQAKGTADNPYLASELYDIVSEYNSGAGPNGTLYVKGFVSKANSPSSNYQTYFISDDGTSTKQFQAYRGKGIDGANMTTTNQVSVGDWVVVSGTAINYNGNTPEFNAGSHIVIHHPKLAAPTFTVAEGTYYTSQSVEIEGPDGASFYYTLDGTTPDENATQYTGAIAIESTITLKAIAIQADHVNSDITEAAYTIAAATKLATPEVTVSSCSHNSINFTWQAIEHATGYAISTDGGNSYGDPQNATEYTWSDLTASTSYTIKVKAIGTTNGQYTDSDPGSCTQSTTAAPILESISLDTNPTKMAYAIGETFNLEGAVVTAHYSNNTSANVTSSCTTDYDGVPFTTLGEKTVTISYTEGGITQTTPCVVTVAVVDVLTNSWTTISGTDYSSKTGLSGSASDAVYHVVAAGGDNNSGAAIQLRSNNSNSGIVTTESGGILKRITIKWNKATADARTLDVYGKNTAYEAPSDLYNSNNQGTKVTSFTKSNGDGSYSFTANYAYIGIRSSSGALYLDEIDIAWEPTVQIVWNLKSIEVTTPPTKTEYTVGEFFNPEGMVVTATYEDQENPSHTKQEVIANSDLTFTPSTSTALTTQYNSIIISYGQKSVSQPITVSATKTYYRLVTNLSEITAGTYVVGALRSTSATNDFYFGKASVSSGDWVVSDGYVTVSEESGVRRFEIANLPSGAVEFTLAGDNTNGFTISNGTKYLYFTDSSNRKLAFASNGSSQKWIVNSKANPLISGGIYLSAVGDKTYTISENSTSTGAIRGYASDTAYRAIYLFKKVTEDSSNSQASNINPVTVNNWGTL